MVDPQERRSGDKGWDGIERRSVPLHLVTYFDGKIAEVKDLLRGHIADETGQFEQIYQRITENGTSSEKRHHALTEQITQVIGHQKLMEDAFIRHENGTPDYHGHHHDHLSRKEAGDWWRGIKTDATKDGFKFVIGAVAGFIALACWELFKASLK